MAIIDSGLGWSCEENYYIYDAGTVVYANSGYDTFTKTNNGGAIAAKVGIVANYTVWIVSTEADNVLNDAPKDVRSVIIDGLTWFVKPAGYLNRYTSEIKTDFPAVEISYNPYNFSSFTDDELATCVEEILAAASTEVKPVSEHFKIYQKTNGIWTEIEPTEI